jgi:hypothetical protein
LLDYIEKKNINIRDYLGIDINPNFIEIASQKSKGTFKCLDIMETEEVLNCDFLFTSGVFNNKFEDNKAFIQQCFERFNQIAKKGFAVNFLSDKVEYKLDECYHSDPAWVLDLAYKYSNNVVLRNDYMPFEFTVFVNKFSEIDEKLTVYKEHIKYV